MEKSVRTDQQEKLIVQLEKTKASHGCTLNQYEAKGILVGALGVLAVHYGYSR